MSKFIGDFAAGDTIDFKFTTYRPSTGAPFTLAGTPGVSVYKANSTEESTAGVTLTADFDSRTGLNHVRITTSSDGTFYSNTGQFEVVVTTGTVDSVSVVGACVGRFTLAAQTNKALTSSVTVGTNNDKTGYSLSAGSITSGTFGAGAITNSVLASGAISNSTFASNAIGTSTIASGAITSSSFGADAITASALAADAAEEIANTVWQADNDTKYGGGSYDVDSLGRTILRSSNTQAEVDVNGNNHVSAVVHQMQSNVVTADALDATAITEIAQGVLTEATSTNTAVYAAGDVGNVLGRLHNMIAADGADFQYTANALELAPSGGGGGGGGWALNTDQTTGLKRMISAIVGVGGETATPGVLEFDMVGETTTLRITQSTDGNDRLTVEEV